MKAITNEVKLRIFAQYIGSDVKVSEGLDRKLIAVGGYEDEPYITLRLGKAGKGQFVHSEFIKHSESRLLLTPLSNITDEDTIDLYKLLGYEEPAAKLKLEFYDREIVESIIGNQTKWDFFTNNSIYQYLQSKGYALPYMAYSVEELIELGIYKLKNR